MKKLILTAFFAIQALVSTAHAGVEGTYGIHLYFNEKEYVDVLTIGRTEDGKLTGMMYVPDDFDAAIGAIQLNGDRFSFELPVPRNSARPEDLLFRYEAKFFDSSYQQMIGFVTIPGSPEFVASFVGFKRKPLTE